MSVQEKLQLWEIAFIFNGIVPALPFHKTEREYHALVPQKVRVAFIMC